MPGPHGGLREPYGNINDADGRDEPAKSWRGGGGGPVEMPLGTNERRQSWRGRGWVRRSRRAGGGSIELDNWGRGRGYRGVEGFNGAGVVNRREEIERGSREGGGLSTSSTSTKAAGFATNIPTPTAQPRPQPSASRDGRLKPPRDASGGHGLVSKGDTKLLSPTAQSSLFTEILEKYTPFITSISSLPRGPLSTKVPPTHRTQHIDAHTATTQTLLLTLRSLREALLATSRLDHFAKDVYVFTARTAILVQHKESYLPSLLHLLHNIHLNNPLTEKELAEFAGYYVIHLACVIRDFNEAYIIRKQFRLRSDGDANSTWADVDAILRALVRNDYWSWAKLRDKVGVRMRRLMEMGEEVILKRVVGCLGKTYFEVEIGWVERMMGIEAEEVRRRVEGADGWEICGEGGEGRVVVRKRPEGKK
ncbi:hypothetical protein BGX38DRAFT_738127 [Terfezia claveryi]|nr:hypothetical protein BGX38DRAFT_738127 [Terfezia claveryi]